MKIEDLKQYLGLPSQNEDFDRFLTAHGIVQRPRYREMPFETIDIPERGIYLVFKEKLGFEKHWGPAREDGEMIFSSFQLFNQDGDAGFARYPHSLPYDLCFESTLAPTLARFGEPTVDHESGSCHVYLWYDVSNSGWTVAIGFWPDDAGIAFLALERAKIKPPRKSRLS